MTQSLSTNQVLIHALRSLADSIEQGKRKGVGIQSEREQKNGEFIISMTVTTSEKVGV